MKTHKTITRIFQKVRDSRNPTTGEGIIASRDVSSLLRIRLTALFPDTKFTVRTEDRGTVNVGWEDGPLCSQITPITNQYTFGGFDGSIDMAYYSDNWLLPDGSMRPAASQGTSGSMGHIQPFTTDCPLPGAVLVGSGPRYVFANRRTSHIHDMTWCSKVAELYGFELNDQPLYSQTFKGDLVIQMAYRLEVSQFEDEQQKLITT